MRPSSVFYLLPLAWLWFRLIDHLRVEWSVNPQYAYGWAVPFLCLYLLWRKAESRKQKAEIGGQPVAWASSPASSASIPAGDSPTSLAQSSKLDVGCSMLDVPHAASLSAGGEGRGEVASSPSSAFRPPFSAFQLFSFFLLAFLYLPTRLIQEANPEWRLVSWALAFDVIGITLLMLPFVLRPYFASRIPHPASRFTFPPSCQPFQLSAFSFSGFVFPICFFLVAVPWPTVIEGPLIQGLMRANVGVTIELLGLIGVPGLQHGNVIEIATGSVGIDDACSGIRSLQAALMLSLFLGELYALSAMRRVLCVCAGFALAFVFNVGRTLLLAWIASEKGIGAIASWHDPAGVTILVACFLSLWLIARALQKAESRKQKAEMGAVGPQDHETLTGVQGSGFKVQGSKLDVGCSMLDVPPAGSLSAGGEGRTEVASPSSVRFLLSAFPISAFKRCQRLSIFLIAWLLLVESGTEIWYRSHEWRLPKTAVWHVELPRDSPTFRDLPFSEDAKRFLRYDQGFNGAWQEPDGTRWQAISFRWKPGRTAVHLAKSHTPEVCMTAAGRALISQSEFHVVAAQGLEMVFRSYAFTDAAGPLHVFYCLWEERANAQSFRTTRMTYANRLAPVLAGRRNSGQRSLEVAIWGIPDEQEAETALARELQTLIKVEK